MFAGPGPTNDFLPERRFVWQVLELQFGRGMSMNMFAVDTFSPHGRMTWFQLGSHLHACFFTQWSAERTTVWVQLASRESPSQDTYRHKDSFSGDLGQKGVGCT